MRTVKLASIAFAIVAAGFAALPAQADIPRIGAPVQAKGQQSDGRGVCARSLADQRCAQYQSALVKAVAQKAETSGRAMSYQDVAAKQLDALIASVD